MQTIDQTHTLEVEDPSKPADVVAATAVSGMAGSGAGKGASLGQPSVRYIKLGIRPWCVRGRCAAAHARRLRASGISHRGRRFGEDFRAWSPFDAIPSASVNRIPQFAAVVFDIADGLAQLANREPFVGAGSQQGEQFLV